MNKKHCCSSMSWSPGAVLAGANWQGNPPLITKNQLLSTSAGLYDDLKDFNFSTISVSTLNVPLWISTAALYVSDIKGANLDISGIIIDASGVFYAPNVSSSKSEFNLTIVSSIAMKGFDNLFDLDVSFDFGLGQAIGGALGGLGALIGGGTIAVGTGAGLAIQGAEQGIATMIAGRPQNFISQTNYETINFTTQLQVSTLGYASPVYSSIFRTVSSISPGEVPGREIFTSSFFYPGQICIRSVSDPFNLITGNSNLNTSTIQSFGQWTSFEGLEPENIVANSLSTNFISAGNAYVGDLSSFANDSYVITNQFSFISTLTVDLQTFAGDNTTMFLQKIIGSNNAFIRTPTVSTINLKAVNIFASTITAETINAISTLFITSTSVEIITSTQTVIADLGIFSSIKLSTPQEIALTSLYNYPGAITAINTATNTTSPLVGFGFKAQINLNCNAQTRIDYNWDAITGTTDASNYYPLATFADVIPNFWTMSNILNLEADSLQANSLVVSTIFTAYPTLSSYTNAVESLGTTGSPGTYLPWFNISTNKQQFQAPTMDVYFGPVGLAANNGPNLGYSGFLTVIGDNYITSPFTPITEKTVFGTSVTAGANVPQNFTFGLRYGVDYDSGTNNLWWYGYSAANNTSFFIPAGSNQIQIRAYPF